MKQASHSMVALVCLCVRCRSMLCSSWKECPPSCAISVWSDISVYFPLSLGNCWTITMFYNVRGFVLLVVRCVFYLRHLLSPIKLRLNSHREDMFHSSILYQRFF